MVYRERDIMDRIEALDAIALASLTLGRLVEPLWFDRPQFAADIHKHAVALAAAREALMRDPDPVATQPLPPVGAAGVAITPLDPAMETALAEIYREHQRRCLTTAQTDPNDDTTTVRCNRDRDHFGKTHVDRYGWRWRA